MVVVLVVTAVLVGGLIGTLSRRGRPARRRPHRGLDSDRVDVQAGFRNTYGGP